MKYALIFFLLITSVYADKLNKKTLGCPSVILLEKAPVDRTEDPMALSMYSVANGCALLTQKDKVEAIGHDPRNSKDIYQKIIYKKTGSYLYILRSSIIVEQGGKKNIHRF